MCLPNGAGQPSVQNNPTAAVGCCACGLQEVPRCVLQLLAVGCILLASKDLEVSQPTVEQLCAVTANHFQVGTAADADADAAGRPSATRFLAVAACACASALRSSMCAAEMQALVLES